MKKVFVDTNIIVDLIADRKPFSKHAIEIFNQAMTSINVEGNFFNYYEMFNNSLYNSPLHQSYLVNNSKQTYKIDIWNNTTNITKIEGLSIIKLNYQIERINE